MISHRCKLCLWWDNEHIRLQHMDKIEWIPTPGICRKHKPASMNVKGIHIGTQPIMDADDFCGEFREDK